MNFLNRILLISTVLVLSAMTAFAEEAPAAPAAKAPSIFLTYSYYKYNLKGDTTANTNIYRFNHGSFEMHLVTATWLYSPDWMFFAFAPYMKNWVETVYEPTPAGLNFQTTDYTEGVGDLRLMAMKPLWATTTQNVMYDFSITAPTGKIDNYFTSAPTQRASYNMQTGSGTWDGIVGVTYSHNLDLLKSTARAEYTFRTGKNKNDYALGNEFQLKLATGYQADPHFNIGAQANYRNRDKVNGRDALYELHNSYTGAGDPSIRGDGHQYYHGSQVNWDVDAVLKFQTALASSVLLGLEAGVPVTQGFQNKDDITFKTQHWFSGSLTAMF